jgi:hypothetical protein
VSNETARRLLVERDQAEHKQREALERREAELAEQAANILPGVASRLIGSPTAFCPRWRCCRPPKTPNRAAAPHSRKLSTTTGR